MSKSDRFAVIIVDLVIAFATGSATVAVALIAAVLFRHTTPLLLALQCGGVVFVATALVCLLAQGARWRDDDNTME